MVRTPALWDSSFSWWLSLHWDSELRRALGAAAELLAFSQWIPCCIPNHCLRPVSNADRALLQASHQPLSTVFSTKNYPQMLSSQTCIKGSTSKCILASYYYFFFAISFSVLTSKYFWPQRMGWDVFPPSFTAGREPSPNQKPGTPSWSHLRMAGLFRLIGRKLVQKSRWHLIAGSEMKGVGMPK